MLLDKTYTADQEPKGKKVKGQFTSLHRSVIHKGVSKIQLHLKWFCSASNIFMYPISTFDYQYYYLANSSTIRLSITSYLPISLTANPCSLVLDLIVRVL